MKQGVSLEEISNRGKQSSLSQVLAYLASINVTSLLVEGGIKLVRSFLKEEFVDKILLFESNSVYFKKGLRGLSEKDLRGFTMVRRDEFARDSLYTYYKTNEK